MSVTTSVEALGAETAWLRRLAGALVKDHAAAALEVRRGVDDDFDDRDDRVVAGGSHDVRLALP